ncbi:hypothetical protein CJF30_00004487 [Rutstroemia sp. NJR-2017a BBW]|nr:hypothetical protein CJF30_00004487 [Rutstroemia sp. NJR-2017a BBW]
MYNQQQPDVITPDPTVGDSPSGNTKRKRESTSEDADGNTHKKIKNEQPDCGEIFSIRWPSLKYNTHRRFCYVTFRNAQAAVAATQLDGTMLENKYKLIAKYSDPANKKQREGAAAEGRELHVTSLDSSLTEDDLKGVFSKYGKVETVRLLRTAKGESKGAGFVVFEKKDDATAALELDKTKLKSSVLHVELTQVKNYKPIATSGGGKASSASPAPEDGASAMSTSPAPDGSHTNTLALHAPSKSEGPGRTIALLNVPDTVNDARIRAIAEPFGTIVKLVLRPDHSGAIIEYEDVASAGKASLGLENHEIAPGRKLRTGGLKDLFAQSGEIKTDRIQIGQGNKKNSASTNLMQPSIPVRRPGGRGGLGQKRGLGYPGAKSGAADSKSNGNGNEDGGDKKPLKSNADFKAMFLSSGKE